MARRRNRNRQPRTSPNNKWGPRAVGIDDDYPMHGTDASPRNGPNRRGGKTRPYQAHNQQHQANQSPFNNAKTNDYSLNNKRGNFRGQRGRGVRGGGRGGRGGGRGGRRGNNNVFDDLTDDPFDKFLPFRGGDAGGGGDDASSSSTEEINFNKSSNSLFQTPSTFTNGSSGSRGVGGRVRSCIECSAVRRANLQFRDWTARVLQRCGERFVAWAEEAGVGFATCDEMDWQPEPVTRVLILTQLPPVTHSITQHDPLPPAPPNLPSVSPNLEGPQSQQNQPHQPQQQGQREHPQQQKQEHNTGPVSTAVTPGPWAWPPYQDVPHTLRPPGTSLPAPTTSAPYTTAAPNRSSNDDNVQIDLNQRLPVSGFGLLGVATTTATAAAPGIPSPSMLDTSSNLPPPLCYEIGG